MEKVTYSTKRKKRRTRRYLDEIRNRLRSGCGDSIEHSFQNTTKSSLMKSTKRKDSLVTMDRLTLKTMFPNAIRSETITRPVLEEIKQKQQDNFVELLKDNSVNKGFSLDQGSLCKDMNTSESFRNKGIYASKENNYIMNDEEKSSSSSVLFSPSTSINKAGTLNRSVNEEDAVASSTSSQEHIINHRCEKLMSEIPSYIKHLAFSVSKEDVVKTTLDNLQQLYMERQHKEYRESIMKSGSGQVTIKNKAFSLENQFIVENPLDYIRLKHKQQNIEGSLIETLNSPSCGPDGGSAEPPWSNSSEEPLPSCGSRNSPRGVHLAKPSARSSAMHLYDTPDYAYYPHPLK